MLPPPENSAHCLRMRTALQHNCSKSILPKKCDLVSVFDRPVHSWISPMALKYSLFYLLLSFGSRIQSRCSLYIWPPHLPSPFYLQCSPTFSFPFRMLTSFKNPGQLSTKYSWVQIHLNFFVMIIFRLNILAKMLHRWHCVRTSLCIISIETVTDKLSQSYHFAHPWRC